MITVDGIQINTWNDLYKKWQDGSEVKITGNHHNLGVLMVNKTVRLLGDGAILAGIIATAPNTEIDGFEINASTVQEWRGAISLFANGCKLRNSYVHDTTAANRWGVLVLNASDCVVDGVRADRNHYGGIRIEAHVGKEARKNLIVNSSAIGNAGSQYNSDGISVSGVGSIGNKISRCKASENADDNFDIWLSTDTIIEYSEAWKSGNGDGNGFKCGKGTGAVVRYNVSHDHRENGFASNGAGVRYEGNIAYNNKVGFKDDWRATGYEGDNSYFKGNAAYNNGKNFVFGSRSIDEGGNITTKPVEPPDFIETDIIVHINYASTQTLRIRSEPSVHARVRGMIYPDPDIRWHVIGVFRDGGNYWGKLGEEMWFALKFDGAYYSDWRE